MSLKNATQSSERDDILFELATQEHLDVVAVKAAVAGHPEFAKDILEFAAEWFEADALASGEAPPTDGPKQNYARALDHFWELAAEPARDPFAAVEPSRLREIAQNADIHVMVLMQLCNRMIEAATIPLRLVKDLAESLAVSPRGLWSHLAGEPRLGMADFKASGSPKVGRKLTFEEAVKSSPMTKPQKEKWLTSDKN